MKKVFAFAIIFLSLIYFKSYCQILKNPVGPVFYAYATKNIDYPIGAIRGSVYGRIYATFEINPNGKVKNVNVVYPLIGKIISQKLGFETEIISGLSKIPNLRNANAGKYILPIAFVYRNIFYGDEIYPTNKISEDYLSKDYQLLEEIQVTARSDQYRSLRPFSGIPPMSRQIVEY